MPSFKTSVPFLALRSALDGLDSDISRFSLRLLEEGADNFKVVEPMRLYLRLEDQSKKKHHFEAMDLPEREKGHHTEAEGSQKEEVEEDAWASARGLAEAYAGPHRSHA